MFFLFLGPDKILEHLNVLNNRKLFEICLSKYPQIRFPEEIINQSIESVQLNPRERLFCISKLHEYYEARPAEFDLLTDDSTRCSENFVEDNEEDQNNMLQHQSSMEMDAFMSDDANQGISEQNSPPMLIPMESVEEKNSDLPLMIVAQTASGEEAEIKTPPTCFKG